MSLFQEACKYIPGGVNSPVRAFRGVGGEPIFFARARGSRVWSADGREYIDYVGSWGPMILGHAHPDVIRAVQETAVNGLSFGAPTEIETDVARKIIELVPSIEIVRMCSSGTEATMSAIRLARGFTGRQKIVKFAGCYHGHSIGCWSRPGPAADAGRADLAGRAAGTRRAHAELSYNDLARCGSCSASSARTSPA